MRTPPPLDFGRNTFATRRAFTLIELLVGVTMTSVLAMALAVLGQAASDTSTYTHGHGTATQHARVNLDRIARIISEATANENFPGAVVFDVTDAGFRYCDTLVVWRPAAGVAAAPAGLPQFKELIVFTPHPTLPNQLLEITTSTDTRTVPVLTNTTQWATELATLRTSNTSKKTLLTDRLRTWPTTSGGTSRRAALRFDAVMHPTAAQWASYRAGTTAWADLPWPQSLYGSLTGLRHVAVRMEVQLNPGNTLAADLSADQAIPFFGSGALFYQLNK